MSIDYQNSILWRGEDPLKRKFKPQYDNTQKVARYRAGQAPAWAREKKEDEEEKEEKKAEDPRKRERRRRREREAAAVIEDTGGNRLKRLQAHQGAAESGSERLLRHRVLHDARVLEEKGEGKKEEEPGDEKTAKGEDLEKDGRRPIAELPYDEISGDEADNNELRALRRERARELALARRKQEEAELVKKEELEPEPQEEEEADEEESEEESESDDDDPRRSTMLKPIFVSKASRDTVREKEALQKEEEEAEVKQKEKVKERKVESKTLLIDEIKRDEEAERDGLNENDASDIELLDDDDEKNEAEEYELWKIRELKRIKRDKEERLDRQKEIEWILKRRAMTDEERMADDKRLDDKSNKRDESKNFGFLQKYYHRGGFFQDKAVSGDEPLYLRDYHEPLEEEKYDKNLLPKAMQLRRGEFGKKGQVKHTHLTEVDTTDFQAAWSQHNKQVQRYQEKMAGAKGVNSFDRPGLSSARGSSSR